MRKRREKKEKYSFEERATMNERITGRTAGSGSDRSATPSTMVESHTSCLRDVGHGPELAIIYLSTLYN